MYCNRMALVIIMLVYFTMVSQYIQCKEITIKNNGSDTNECCVEGKCLCSSLSRALHSVKSDTTIKIAETVPLNDYVHVEQDLNNVTITGNDVTIMCNNKGGMSWGSGDNVVIEGITWDQCGNPEHTLILTPAFEFDNVHNISIIGCTFQYSGVCKTMSLIGEGEDMSIYIVNSNFFFNKVENSSVCQDGYGSLFIEDKQNAPVKYAKISITGSLFYSNGNSNQPEPSFSVFNCSCKSPQNLSIVIEHSEISSNAILGAFLHNNAISSYLLFNNVTVSNNSQGGVKIVSTKDYMTLDILSSIFIMNNNGSLVLNVSKENIINFNQVTFAFNKGAFDSQGVAVYLTARDNSIIYLFNCSIEYNDAIHGYSIVYIAAQDQLKELSGNNVTVLVNASMFSNNLLGSSLHLSHVKLTFYNSVLFQNNTAEAGAAIYVDQNSAITVTDESFVQFVSNTASLRGGAIYVDLTNCINNGILFNPLSNPNSIVFINNAARISGNSIYFNIPKSCSVQRDYNKNDSVAYIPYKLNYTQSHNTIGPAIAASPYRIRLCSEKCNSTGENCEITRKRMLGQLISFSAAVCDYFNAIAETVQFRLQCTDCNTKYILPNNELLFNSKSPNGISVLAVGASNDVVNNTNITFQVSSVLSDNYREFSAELSFVLSGCYNGFVFRINLQKCECYNYSDSSIMQCQGNYAEIKLGYWFGIIFNNRTTSLCPINYCDFNHRMKTRSDYYVLPGAVDDQCSSHRTGVVCSDCKSGYTLAYDSFDCVDVNQCSPGMTVLVIGLTFLYWIVIVATLFGLTYYFNAQVSSGYFNGVIYFYSIVDILLVRNLHIVDGVFYAVAALSSFAKLTPQVLGKLCFVQGLDAIDQQFIHYSHPLCVSFILIGIVIAAKCSTKVAFYVKHCIAHVVFLFLVLSYTSVASISLQLLRAVQFNDHDGVFVYLSPDLKYYTQRHAVYVTIALLCGLVLVIGLPLLLLVEPLLRKKAGFERCVQMAKLRPILDQFQSGYRDNYQCFAAYYLLCRLVIMLIAYFGNSDYSNMVYYMQTACVIFVINQLCFHPYKKHAVNILDTAILLTMLLVVNLNNFDFNETTMVGWIYTVLFIPLLLLSAVGFAQPIKSLRMKWRIFNITPMIRR